MSIVFFRDQMSLLNPVDKNTESQYVYDKYAEIALFGYPEDIFSSFLDRSSYYIHHWAGKIL